jgi:hypothetical protein
MKNQPTITDTQFLEGIADILEMADAQPETMDDANQKLHAIQDAAAQAVADDLA